MVQTTGQRLLVQSGKYNTDYTYILDFIFWKNTIMAWNKGKLGTLCMVRVGLDFRIRIASALDSLVDPHCTDNFCGPQCPDTSCRPADHNMLVGRPAGSSSKAPLRIPSQKIHHLCYYGFFKLFICLICCFYFCYVPLFYFFFQGIHNENNPNKGSDAVRTL